MTITELEQVTREYIRDITKKEFKSRIYIEPLTPIGYSIKLELGMRNKPLTIYAELEDSKFLKFLKQELKDRNFQLIYYGELNLRPRYDCTPLNQPCECHKIS